MRLPTGQASALFEGLQWSRMHAPRGPKPVTTRLAVRASHVDVV